MPKAKRKAFRKYNPTKAKAVENPFDKFANSKKKHEVVNRRVKGEDRNVGRAREKALEARRTKLMADYKSSQKSNVFFDRRFGEDDANLSLEEKMFMRFQKEKITKVKRAAKFNLDDAEEVTLTHKGKALSEFTSDPSHWSDEDDGDDENLGREVVNTLHFGGGFKPTGRSTEDAVGDSFKSGRDALQEIVMKSKLAKLEKREAKDAQEKSRLTLDSAYEDLISSAVLDFKPTKRDRSEDVDNEKQDPDAVNYDTALRAMAFEARAQATDRTKSKEELAVAELKRLHELEEERQRRMRADPDEGLISSALGDKNGVDRKKKRVTDDDIDELCATQGGNDQTSDQSDYDGDEIEDEVDDFGNSHNILDEESDDEDGEDSDEDDDAIADGDSSESSSNHNDEDGGDDDASTEEPAVVKKIKFLKDKEKAIVAAPVSVSGKEDNTINTDMPHVLHCPSSVEEFDDLLNDYVKNPQYDLPALISRIMTTNSVHLPEKGTSKSDNMAKMSIFLDILFVHFIRVGDVLISMTEQEDINSVLAQLHCLSSVIFQLAQDVPDACRASAVKLIKNMQSTLQRRMRAYQSGEISSCWLGLGHILLLQEFGHVFATSDFRHGIVTPSFLLICQCLTQCPLVSVADASSGLLLSCIILNYTEKSEKFVPEVFFFLERLLRTLNQNFSSNMDVNSESLFCLLAFFSSEAVVIGDERRIPWQCFNPCADTNVKDAAISVFHTIFVIMDKLSEKYKTSIAYPELFEGLSKVFTDININTVGEFESSPYFAAYPEHAAMIKKIQDNRLQMSNTRQCLKWRIPKRKIEKMLTPAFEVDYKLKKSSNTTNSDAVKLKVLQKQVKREEKATMRELRRDAEFIARERMSEKDLVRKARKEERAKNFAWLEDQHATFKQQVRVSKGALKGGGSGDVKPPRKREKRSKATSR